MPSAIGSSIQPTPTPGVQTKVAGRDFWRTTIPGSIHNNPVYDHNEINTVIQTLIAKDPNASFDVFLPAQPQGWQVDGPIYGFASGQVLYGESGSGTRGPQINTGLPGTLLVNNIYYKGPVVFATPPPPTVQAGTYVNVTSLMDGSVAGIYGIRHFGGNNVFAYWGSGFQLGGQGGNSDIWQGTAYTIAFACTPTLANGTPGGIFNAQQFFGIGSSSESQRLPFLFQFISTTQFQLAYIAADGVLYGVTCNYSGTTGLHRFYIMIDVNRVSFPNLVNIYVDTGTGPKIASYAGNGSPAPGVGINAPIGMPFKLGNCELLQHFDTYTQNKDFITCGLHFENQLTYADGSTRTGGTTGTLYRSDTANATTFNDNYAFFTMRNVTTGGLLTLTNNGALNPQEVYVLMGGYNYSYGFLFSGNVTAGDPIGITIRDIAIYAASSGTQWQGGSGTALLIGPLLDITIENCTLVGGAFGVNSPAPIANVYTVILRNCTISGSYMAVYAQNTELYMQECYPSGGWRDMVYLSASPTWIRDFWLTNSSFVQHYIHVGSQVGDNQATTLMVHGMVDDNEGLPCPTEAWIRADGCAIVNLSNFSSARVPTPSPVTNPNGTYFLILGGPGLGVSIPNVTMSACNNYTAGGANPAGVKIEYGGWRGKIELWNGSPASAIDDHTAGTHGVKVYSNNYLNGTPRSGNWVSGRHDIDVIATAPGQPSKMMCTGTGAYGTATLPAWTPQLPHVPYGTNPCAGYVNSGFAINGTAASTGVILDSQVNAILNLMFGGGAYTSAPFYLGISATYSERDGAVISEITGNGYARQAINWSAPSGGATASTAGITFPTSTGLWNPYQPPDQFRPATGGSIKWWFMASSGNPALGVALAWGTFATPFSITATGQTAPVIATGALTVTHIPSTLGSWTTYGANSILSTYIGPTPLVPGASWYLGLSSTPINQAGFGGTEPASGSYARAAFHGNALPSGGTISSTSSLTNIIGIGTLFLTDLKVGQIINIAGTVQPWKIASITDNTHFTISIGTTLFGILNPNTPTGTASFFSTPNAGQTSNLNAIAFPAPSASWGATLGYWFLADAATNGNVWASGPLIVPISVTSSASPTPSFAAGTLIIGIN